MMTYGQSKELASLLADLKSGSEPVRDKALREHLDEIIEVLDWAARPVDQPKGDLDQQALEAAKKAYARRWMPSDSSHFTAQAEAQVRYIIEAYINALATKQAGEGPTSAWLAYWPGAGSIDSVTYVTRSEYLAKRWRADGAEITELVERRSALTAIPAAGVGEAVAWLYESAHGVDALRNWANFQKRLSFERPVAPLGSEEALRNVTPLFAASPAVTEREQALEAVAKRAIEHLRYWNVSEQNKHVQSTIDDLVRALKDKS